MASLHASAARLRRIHASAKAGRGVVARSVLLAIGLSLALAGVSVAADVPNDWNWLVPMEGAIPVVRPTSLMLHHLPGSTQRFNSAQLRDLKHAVDWFPGEHPTMPAIVSEGHDKANACGFCHLPTGNGRPENSSLAGLPADYIKRQVAAFADGSRQTAAPNSLPLLLMAATAKGVSPSELEQAADYFSKLPYVSYVEVVETATAAFKPAPFIYKLQPGPKSPIGDRIIEVPVDFERFEQRDPHMRFIAYVPPGSIAAGRTLVETGGPSGQPCATCHGDGLRGGIAPPLAGRSPTMIVRQLAAFHEGARRNPEAEPMRVITSQLDTKMMISVAAYVASMKL
jgi:cytochrome c553